MAPYEIYITNGIIQEPIYANNATAPKKRTIFPYCEPEYKLHMIIAPTINNIIHITQPPH